MYASLHSVSMVCDLGLISSYVPDSVSVGFWPSWSCAREALLVLINATVIATMQAVMAMIIKHMDPIDTPKLSILMVNGLETLSKVI